MLLFGRTYLGIAKPEGSSQASRDDVFAKLRAAPAPMIAQAILKDRPELVNDALNDTEIFEKLGGPEGVRTLALFDLPVCLAVMASEIYPTFNQEIKHGIEVSRDTLAGEELSRNAAKCRK